jgi:hypothetical protein
MKYSLNEAVSSSTVSNAIKLLNDAFDSDPDAISKLFAYRVPCNEKLADHDTIQVREEDDGTYSLSVLGILNGLFGKDAKGVGYIKAEIEDGEDLQGFHK